MAHAGSQVPYDPLVAQDHDDDHSSHHNTLHSHLNTNTYPPSHSSSSLPPGAYLPPVGPPTTGGTITYNTPYRDTPSPAPHQSTEFGAPTPGFFYTDQPGTRASYASGPSIASRGSAYGSIAPLHNDRADVRASGYTDDQWGGSREASGHSTKQQPDHQLYEKDNLYEAPRAKSKRKAKLWICVVICALIVLVAVLVPLYLFVFKKKNHSGSGSNSGNSGNNSGGGHSSSGHGDTPTVLTWGGDGSIVTKDDGSTFQYNNSFGGYWVYDPANPLNESARAQAASPPISQLWKWGDDQIFGVNLGGWLTLEPFISPALYQPFEPDAVDEWTLSEHIQTRDGNLNAIEDHYKTFITEEDFAMIAAAGLNWVRIPLPYWAIETYPGEPFLARTSWTYFLKAIGWARKYGLRINLDLHAVPGSQNGWNHSGKSGSINFLNGVMGVANAQRTLDYIRILAEFISQEEYRNVVPFFGIINEPGTGMNNFPKSSIQAFYAEAYRIIRNAGGVGTGHGPVISIHEAYFGLGGWPGFLTGADRLALDQHTYLVFQDQIQQPVTAFPTVPCESWSANTEASLNAFGLTGAGEWSFAINDCGLYVNAVGMGTRYEGTMDGKPRTGDCAPWIDYTTWDQSTKDSLRGLGLSSMDSLRDSFFWTWRIGESTRGRVEAPFWSYKLAIQEGWAPANPRDSAGQCAKLGSTVNGYVPGSLQSWQVGGAGAGTVPSLDSYPWPPTEIGGVANAATLPMYTATGAISTLPGPTPTQSGNGNSAATPTVDFGNGWANPDDTTLMAVPVSGCTYPNPWNAVSAAIPACGVLAKREPAPTAAPAPAL